ncbi:YoaK family protein [Pseudoduganella violaceinigra]|uniref:YoaK family protein n=1 Tax=Pseudoduganella violaceinigra TaxID=246602 RepID=UPI0003F8A96E|nr:YoaK family protein [Pseudoduganella violaceinigra]
MPINYVRRLTGRQRAAQANRHLGIALAFVAGAANAGGFLAVKQYTSHMTGIVSSAADDIALGAFDAALDCAGAFLAFLAGAACCAIMVNFARRRQLHSEFALPLLLEAVLLLAFGVMGARLQAIDVIVLPATVTLLCFMMGLQNAVITKLSNAEIRTTHMTGIVTDLGIEAGKALYWNRDSQAVPRVAADWRRMRILGALLLSFFIGALAGAFGFKLVGFGATLPLAAVLLLLAIVPILDDLRSRPH